MCIYLNLPMILSQDFYETNTLPPVQMKYLMLETLKVITPLLTTIKVSQLSLLEYYVVY